MSATPRAIPASTAAPVEPVPQLEPGDRLTRAEFERRYRAMPHVKKAELIEGIVHMPSPVRADRHGRPHARLIGLISNYEAMTPGVLIADNSTAKLDTDNESQPDVLLMIEAECGGQAKLEDGFITGAPELLGEIAASSVSIDTHLKKHVYRRNGVREYIIWRVDDRAIDWFVLHEGEYVPHSPVDNIYKSTVFPGLWLNTTALLKGDMAAALETVRAGCASSEHEQFVQTLARRRAQTG